MGFPIAILAELAVNVAARALDRDKPATPNTEVVAELTKAIETNPVLKNELNGEAPYQSRVAIGSVIAALGVVIPPIAGLFGWTVDGGYIVEFGSSCVTLAGAGYALYGRFKSGLKPLFSRG